jgi:hypothetical protein
MRRFFSDRRWKTAAKVLALLYALCVIGPAIALAYNNDAGAHCLTDEHVQSEKATNHVHHDGSTHDHSAPSDHHGQSEKCCGLFGFGGITPNAEVAIQPQLEISLALPPLAQALSGRGFDRIDRPPRSLLSF